MDEVIEEFVHWCITNGWTVKKSNTVNMFPVKITQRYPRALASDYAYFVKLFAECVTNDRQSWFLCEEDYEIDSNEVDFGWNNMEYIELLAAEDDDERIDIQHWWDDNLPIFISVRDGYSHFSLSLKDDSFGQIFEGYEPMFEETIKVADSFEDFLRNIMNRKIDFS